MIDAQPIPVGVLERGPGVRRDSAPAEFASGRVAELPQPGSAWIERVTEERASPQDGLVRELVALNDHREALARDEDLVLTDYLRQLRSGNERAADLATGELGRIGVERAALDGEAADLQARLAEWGDPDVADAVLDWWSEFSAAIRGEVVNAEGKPIGFTNRLIAGVLADEVDQHVALDRGALAILVRVSPEPRRHQGRSGSRSLRTKSSRGVPP